jgi:hypothetical protein
MLSSFVGDLSIPDGGHVFLFFISIEDLEIFLCYGNRNSIWWKDLFVLNKLYPRF